MAQLKINRGTTYIRSGTVSIDGVPADISTATVRFTMKTSEYDDDTDDSTASVLKMSPTVLPMVSMKSS